MPRARLSAAGCGATTSRGDVFIGFRRQHQFIELVSDSRVASPSRQVWGQVEQRLDLRVRFIPLVAAPAPIRHIVFVVGFLCKSNARAAFLGILSGLGALFSAFRTALWAPPWCLSPQRVPGSLDSLLGAAASAGGPRNSTARRRSPNTTVRRCAMVRHNQCDVTMAAPFLVFLVLNTTLLPLVFNSRGLPDFTPLPGFFSGGSLDSSGFALTTLSAGGCGSAVLSGVLGGFVVVLRGVRKRVWARAGVLRRLCSRPLVVSAQTKSSATITSSTALATRRRPWTGGIFWTGMPSTKPVLRTAFPDAAPLGHGSLFSLFGQHL